ncbi:MAG: VOC family protein [Proteobacteria bacterium]|nr:VOC family protein [Pseudomonadota bacterium]
MPVTGIGGVFFRAQDPEALKAWYKEHLGVAMDGWDPWQQQAGPTVFMPSSADTDQFPAAKQWMLNYRVEDLDGMKTELRAAGIEVTTNPEWDTPETGKFAHIHDPEGNRIELWEPPVE